MIGMIRSTRDKGSNPGGHLGRAPAGNVPDIGTRHLSLRELFVVALMRHGTAVPCDLARCRLQSWTQVDTCGAGHLRQGVIQGCDGQVSARRAPQIAGSNHKGWASIRAKAGSALLAGARLG